MTQNKFFTSLPYLIFISMITLIIWYLGMQQFSFPWLDTVPALDIVGLGILLFSVIIFIILLSCKQSIYIFPYLLNMLFMIAQTDWDLTVIPIYLYIVPVLLLLGFVLHAVIYRVKIYKGKFFLPLLVLAIGVITSTIINTETWTLFDGLLLLLPIFFLMMYGFFANTIEGDYLVYLIRIFVILGLMISLQVFIYYLMEYMDGGTQAVIDALEHKAIDLGWGISNFVATYLIMFITTTIYFVKKYKLHIFWILVALFEIVMLLFTLSRAGLLAFIGTSVFLILFMFIRYEHKWNLLLNLIIGILIFSVIGYFTQDFFITIWERLELLKLDDTGRIELWEEAIQTIKASPFFGKGLFARSEGVGDFELRLIHNTLLQAVASFGILGGLSLLLQLIAILRIFFTHFNHEKAILLIALIGANLHGLVDNTYFMPQYLFIMMIIIATTENANKIDAIRYDLLH